MDKKNAYYRVVVWDDDDPYTNPYDFEWQLENLSSAIRIFQCLVGMWDHIKIVKDIGSIIDYNTMDVESSEDLYIFTDNDREWN